jgi:hypothetical protein
MYVLGSSGKKGREVVGKIPVRGMAGVGGEGVNELQELKTHMLGAWKKEGDGRRRRSHGGRGGGGGALDGEGVSGEEKGQAWA